ncbi:MAG: hypothetical protein NVSMB1_10190 [Polyangiales bacterium]
MKITCAKDRRSAQMLLAFLLGALPLASCSIHLKLDPSFALRAEELPMDTYVGVFPPKNFAVGAYHVSEVSLETDTNFTLALGSVEAHFGGNWRLHGGITGPNMKQGAFDCTGPGAPWEDPARHIHVSFGGEARLGCNFRDSSQSWSLLFDVEFRQNENVPEWARKMEQAGWGTPYRDPRDTRSVMVGDDGRVIFIDWARQHEVLRSVNTAGYYLRVANDIVAAVDVSALGAPHAYVARDAPLELRPQIVAAIAMVYLVEGMK